MMASMGTIAEYFERVHPEPIIQPRWARKKRQRKKNFKAYLRYLNLERPGDCLIFALED